MIETNKIISVTGTKSTGKTDWILRNLKLALINRPTIRSLTIDSFDNPAWRTMETHDDLQNQTPINIIRPDQIAHWNTDPTLRGQRMMRTASSNIAETFEQAAKYLYNSILVVEDATRMIRNGRLSDYQAEVIYNCKQKNLDIIFVWHYISKIPTELAGMTDFLVIGKGKEIYSKDIQKRFPDPEVKGAIEAAQKSKDQFIKIPLDVGA